MAAGDIGNGSSRNFGLPRRTVFVGGHGTEAVVYDAIPKGLPVCLRLQRRIGMILHAILLFVVLRTEATVVMERLAIDRSAIGTSL
jgi:hypothetical protein